MTYENVIFKKIKANLIYFLKQRTTTYVKECYDLEKMNLYKTFQQPKEFFINSANTNSRKTFI